MKVKKKTLSLVCFLHLWLFRFYPRVATLYKLRSPSLTRHDRLLNHNGNNRSYSSYSAYVILVALLEQHSFFPLSFNSLDKLYFLCSHVA